MINQKKIVDFVNKIERKKKFKRDYNLVFRHLISEMGELDAAIHRYETGIGSAGTVKIWREAIGEELWDIIFLSCYLADIFSLDLKNSVHQRMESIALQYGIPFK